MYPNYPNQSGGYPTQPPNPYGYPNAPNTGSQGYPNVAPLGFNSFDSQPAYPQPGGGGGGYPPQPNAGYPSMQPGYPSSQPGYPSSQPGYPSGGQYPSFTGAQAPSYPGGGYPSQQPSAYPSSSNSWFDPAPQVPGGLPAHIQSNPNFQPNQPIYGGYQPTGPTAPINQGFNNQPPMMNQGGFSQPPVIQGGHSQTSTYTPPANPTLKPYSPFNPSDDCAKLYKAMKGIGTDETTLIDILCKRTSAQRQEIAMSYKTGYGKDLLKNLESELKGNFERLFKTLMRTPAQAEAKDLMNAIDGLGTNEAALIDIICTKNNAEMNELKNAFRTLFNKDLESALRSESSGYFKRFLTSLSASHRSEQPADPAKALQQAKELYEAGEKKAGTNEVTFNRIFAAESFAQLRAIFENYYRLTGHDIEKAIKSEMSGDVERAFIAVAQTAKNPAIYWANRLHETMAVSGTHDRSLIRIMVMRSEKDMQDIKVQFQSKYRKTLESFIKSDCSGDYKRGLLCLAGDSHWR